MEAKPAPSARPTTVGNGRYELHERPIGAGAMAEVWMAYDTRLRATVAIKMLKPHVAANKGIRGRFVNEASTMFKLLVSPNIVRVIDVVDAWEECFIAMEYVRGRSAKEELGDALAECGEAMAPVRALFIAIEVLKALVVAHKAGVVHCDIKSENVLCARDGRVLLMDFGIAHLEWIEQTAPSEVLGTMGYLAPEIGEIGYVSEPPRDIYAVGCLLYELSTGQKPPQRLYEAVRDPKWLKPVPEVLRTVILRATHYVKEMRYASAQEMLEALETHRLALEEGPSLTPPTPAPPPPATAQPSPAELPPLPKSRAARARERIAEREAQRSPPAKPEDIDARVALGGIALFAALLALGVFAWPSASPDPTAPEGEMTIISPPAKGKPEGVGEPEAPPATEVPDRESRPEATKGAGGPLVAPTIVEAPKVGETARRDVSSARPAAPEPQDTTPRLVHKPVTKARAGSTVTIAAEVRNAEVEKVWLFWRTAGATKWESIAMKPSGASYAQNLSADAPGVEYYIDARPREGSPLTHGSRTQPNLIAVTP